MITSINNSSNAINNAAVASSTTASTASSSGSASSMTQSDFLQLLTAQLKYQSPASPADPTQLAQEFASISTVDGINQLNTKLSAMSTASGTSQIAQASSLVGRQVAVSGNTLLGSANGTATGVFSLPTATANTTVTVLNSNGSVAETLNLGALSAGQQNFSWANATPGSSYHYQVSADDQKGNEVNAALYSVYNVQGVTMSGSSPSLNISGSASTLPVSDVQIVLGASS